MTEEHKFCDYKGDVMRFDMLTILKTLKSQRMITFENIANAYTVARECILGKSDSWLVHSEIKSMPIALTVPLTKKRASEEEVKFMAKCYEASADDDLALAKECEGMNSDIDIDSSQ